MKDKDTQLIWEAYGSDDRVSTGIGQENRMTLDVNTIIGGLINSGLNLQATQYEDDLEKVATIVEPVVDDYKKGDLDAEGLKDDLLQTQERAFQDRDENFVKISHAVDTAVSYLNDKYDLGGDQE